MNTKITFSKTNYFALFTAVMLFAATSAFAQVKIGANPTVIGPNSNLEVEASTPNRKMTVDKVSGQVTIKERWY